MNNGNARILNGVITECPGALNDAYHHVLDCVGDCTSFFPSFLQVVQYYKVLTPLFGFGFGGRLVAVCIAFLVLSCGDSRDDVDLRGMSL